MCDAFSRGSAAKEGGGSPTVPSPNWTSKVRGREAETQKEAGAKAAGHERDQLALHAVQLFLYASCPPMFLSPAQSLFLHCQEHTLVERSEKTRTISSLWEQRVSFVVIPLFSSAQGPRMGHCDTRPV